MSIDPPVPMSPPSDEDLDRTARELTELGSHEDHLDWIAFMYYSHERWARAHDCYANLVSRVPTNGSYHFYLAECLVHLGRADQARPHWEKVLVHDPLGHYARLARERLGTTG